MAITRRVGSCVLGNWNAFAEAWPVAQGMLGAAGSQKGPRVGIEVFAFTVMVGQTLGDLDARSRCVDRINRDGPSMEIDVKAPGRIRCPQKTDKVIRLRMCVWECGEGRVPKAFWGEKTPWQC